MNHLQSIMRTWIAAALLFCSVSAASSQTPTRTASVARIDSIVDAGVGTSYAGVQIAVVKGRDTLLMKGYGLANVELGVPMNIDHVLRIGSLTKQFTSAAVMQLVERGKVSLDDPISKYVANTPPHWSGVKISHLLTHTSGTQSHTELSSIRPQMDLMGMPRDSIVQLMARQPLMYEPGTGFYYNNGGYFLLGIVVEKASGQPYADYVEQMVAPLGLTQTRYCETPPIIHGRVDGYTRVSAGGFTNAPYFNMNTAYAAGALCSTARDIVKWSHALMSGRVVQPTSVRTMTTPMRYGSIRRPTYGMALTADSMGGHLVVSHTGSINGFSAMLMHAPADSLIVAVLTNTGGAPALQIARGIVRTILGIEEPREIVLDAPVTDAERRTLVGRYAVALPDGTRGEMTVSEENGRLMLKLPNASQPMPLHRQNAELFAVPGREGLKIWVEMRNGVVHEITYDIANRPLVGRPAR